MRPPSVPLLLAGLILAAVPPLRAAQPDPSPAAEPAKTVAPAEPTAPAAPAMPDAAMAGWVRQVHGVVIKAAGSLGRRLAPGTYRVGFTVDEHGRGSTYEVEGEKPDSRQSTMIMGALISRSFPAPPDGASHAVRFTLRNGTPLKPPAAGKPPVDDKPPPAGTKPRNRTPAAD